MRQGRLVQKGSPRELYHHPVDASAARFFSEFNEFTARVEGDKVKTPLGPVPAGAVARGAEAVVMIRPRGLRPAKDSEFGTEGRIVEARFLGDELNWVWYSKASMSPGSPASRRDRTLT